MLGSTRHIGIAVGMAAACAGLTGGLIPSAIREILAKAHPIRRTQVAVPISQQWVSIASLVGMLVVSHLVAWLVYRFLTRRPHMAGLNTASWLWIFWCGYWFAFAGAVVMFPHS